MNKTDLSETDIRTKFITPAIVGVNESKWNPLTQMLKERQYFTAGRVNVRGKSASRGPRKRVDYILYYKPNLPLAIVEAKDASHTVGAGMPQALGYADDLDIPFVYSSNGEAFLEHDRTGMSNPVTREISMDEFPGPEELWQRYCAWKGISTQQQVVLTQPYYADGGKSPRYFQRVAFLCDRNILAEHTKTNGFNPFGAAMTKITNRQVAKSFEIYLSLYQALSGSDDADSVGRNRG